MGMSASQARLLSLQARQSNLEYQGQQINQARSILSQQCTALYNSLLSMTVPTPPSTTDYTTIQYSGTQGSSKFTVGTITPNDDGTYNTELKYSRNGNAIKGGDFLPISSYNVPEKFYGTKATKAQSNIEVKKGFEVAQNISTLEIGNTGTKPDALTNNSPVMHQITSAEELAKFTNKTLYVRDGNDFLALSATDFAGAKTEAKNIAANDYTDTNNNSADFDVQIFVATTVGELNEINKGEDGTGSYNWNGDSSDYAVAVPEILKEYAVSGGVLETALSGVTIYSSDGKIIDKDSLKTYTDILGNKVYELPAGCIISKSTDGPNSPDSVDNPSYDKTAAAKNTGIEGQEPQDFSKETLRDAYSSALQAIANSYPEYKTDGAPDAGRIAAAFKVIFRKNDAGVEVPYFVKSTEYKQQTEMSNKNGQGRVEIFSLEPNGSYDESVPTNNCRLKFDSTGRITTIEIPIKDADGKFIKDKDGKIKYDKIDLKASKVTDDAAYKDAYAKYEYETYLYDQKNKEINAQTEAIQQEDRNLELKLQRLDNERTQITTEIEAVEKVINDNIEASYKTFSG